MEKSYSGSKYACTILIH